MPLYFFDTSALVKRYHVEAGSEKVDEILFNAAIKEGFQAIKP